MLTGDLLWLTNRLNLRGVLLPSISTYCQVYLRRLPYLRDVILLRTKVQGRLLARVLTAIRFARAPRIFNRLVTPPQSPVRNPGEG